MNKPILFKQDGCGACIEQDKYLHENFSGTIYQVNLSKFPNQFEFIQFTPTWAIPLGGDRYRLFSEIVKTPQQLERLNTFGRKRGSRFGNKTALPGINDLQVYGKNFQDGQGFKTNNSFYKTIENDWGKGNDTLNAGIGGSRSLGPNNINQMYSSDYLNNIRMAHPSDQLGTALALNRTCNTKGSMSSAPGLVSGSGNPQIVDGTTGAQFGKKKRLINKKNYLQKLTVKYCITRSGSNKQVAKRLWDLRKHNMSKQDLKKIEEYLEIPRSKRYKGKRKIVKIKCKQRRSRFGNKGLYSQMGPASEIGNQYLLGKDTVKGLYGGATQFEGPRPMGVESNTFLGKAKLYSSGSGKTVAFGKKSRKNKKRSKFGTYSSQEMDYKNSVKDYKRSMNSLRNDTIPVEAYEDFMENRITPLRKKIENHKFPKTYAVNLLGKRFKPELGSIMYENMRKTNSFGKMKNKKRLTKKRSKTLNVSGKKAVNIKINIKQKNSAGKRQ